MAFIPVSRYVTVTKIHHDFPELWSQICCHIFWFTVYMCDNCICILQGLTPLTGWQQGFWPLETCVTYPQKFSSEQVEEDNLGEPAIQGLLWKQII